MSGLRRSGAGEYRELPSKDSLRNEVRGRLNQIAMETRAAAAAHIDANVWTMPEMRSARVLLLYASLPSEVPTDGIAREAGSRGVQVVYPRCLPDRVAMTLHAVDGAEKLVSVGHLGMREPLSDCPVVELNEIDIAFLPGLAWDRAGNRLGRGAGYYDRHFAQVGDGPIRVGLFFAAQEVIGVPADPWDIPLDAIVTEVEVIRRKT